MNKEKEVKQDWMELCLRLDKKLMEAWADNNKLKCIINDLSARVIAQSELLAKAAEKKP